MVPFYLITGGKNNMIQDLIYKYINNPVQNTNNNKVLGTEKYEGCGTPPTVAQQMAAEILIEQYSKEHNKKKNVNEKVIEDDVFDEYGFPREED